MVTDPIADMLNRITTAGSAGKAFVTVPYSSLRIRVANILLAEDMVASVVKKAKKGDKAARWIEIALKYDDTNATHPFIQGLARVSKPSRRIYKSAKDLHVVRQGHGFAILSTPKGVMTDKEARKENVGGEVLCIAW